MYEDESGGLVGCHSLVIKGDFVILRFLCLMSLITLLLSCIFILVYFDVVKYGKLKED